MFVYKAKGIKLSMGTAAMPMRLPSLSINARDHGCCTVWMSNAAMQSTRNIWLKTSPQGSTSFQVMRNTFGNPRFTGFDPAMVCYAHQR